MNPQPWKMRRATPCLGDFDDVEAEELLQVGLGHVEQLDEIHSTKLYRPDSREALIANLNNPNRRQLPDNLGIASFATMIHKPSITKLDDLTPIAIADLKLEIRHHGTILPLRTITKGYATGFVENVAEDVNGRTSLFWLAGEDGNGTAAYLAGRSAVFAVKEPYFTIQQTGSPCIEIFHKSDIIWLPPEHLLRPLKFKPVPSEADRTSSVLKTKGNAALQAKEYAFALQCYTSGIHNCPSADNDLLAILYNNRSQLCLHMGQFEAATEDAYRAIAILRTQDSSGVTTKSAQAHYRLGKAYYGLGKFQQARNAFTEALKTLPADQTIKQEKMRAEARLKEQISGEYDFVTLRTQVKKHKADLDIAPYNLKVEKRVLPGQGERLHAKTAFKPGQLVLCDKAFVHRYSSNPDTFRRAFVLTELFKVYQNVTTKLWFAMLQQVHNNPGQASAVFGLDAGEHAPLQELVQVDGETVIDAFHVLQIVARHTLSAHLLLSGSTGQHDDSIASAGFWTMASYAKHACDGNTTAEMIGDVLTLRAVRSIAAGEEISFAHNRNNGDSCRVALLLDYHFSLKCVCNICQMDGETPPSQLRLRERLFKEALTLKQHFSKSSTPALRSQYWDRIPELRSELARTYDVPGYDDMPKLRLAIVDFSLHDHYIGQAGKIGLAVKYGLSALKHMGFRVTIKNDRIGVNRKHAFLMDFTTVMLVRCSLAYMYFGKEEIGKSLKALATTVHAAVRNGNMAQWERLLDDTMHMPRAESIESMDPELKKEIFG